MSQSFYHVFIEYDQSYYHIYTSTEKEIAELCFEDAGYIAAFIPDHTLLPTAIASRYNLLYIYKKEPRKDFDLTTCCFVCPGPRGSPATIYLVETKSKEINIEEMLYETKPYIEILDFKNYRYNGLIEDEFYCN